MHRLLALRARLRGGPGHLRADDRGTRLRVRVSPGMHRRTSSIRNAYPAAPAFRPARPTRCSEKSVLEMGQPEHSVVTTCAYCGVGCSFKAEMRGDELVRMVPYKDGKANRGHSCVKGRFAYGYSTHKDRILNPMIREKITDPWREVTWDEAFTQRANEFRRIQYQYGAGLDRRHHLVALHQRGDLSRPEAGAPGLRQQQRRHLRPRLPLADRLRARPDLRHLGRHAGFQFGRSHRRRHDHRRQPDRRSSGVRVAAEEAAAQGRQADRARPAPHRHRALARMSRHSTICR